MQIQKLKLGQQNNDEGSINLAGANKRATLKCKKIIIKTLAKLYESVYCHSTDIFSEYSKPVYVLNRFVFAIFARKRNIAAKRSIYTYCNLFFDCPYHDNKSVQ